MRSSSSEMRWRWIARRQMCGRSDQVCIFIPYLLYRYSFPKIITNIAGPTSSTSLLKIRTASIMWLRNSTKRWGKIHSPYLVWKFPNSSDRAMLCQSYSIERFTRISEYEYPVGMVCRFHVFPSDSFLCFPRSKWLRFYHWCSEGNQPNCVW